MCEAGVGERGGRLLQGEGLDFLPLVRDLLLVPADALPAIVDECVAAVDGAARLPGSERVFLDVGFHFFDGVYRFAAHGLRPAI